jgi:hypothetical protein
MKKLLKSYPSLPLWQILALCVAFGGMPALAQAPQPPEKAALPAMPRSITVQGEAHEDFQPDQAVMSFSVVSRGKVLTDVKKTNDDTMNKLVQVTDKLGIAKEKVATSGVFVSPEYSYSNKQNVQTLVGYTVNRSMRVTLSDLTKQEPLLAAVLDIKIDQVNNVEFQLSDPEKFASAVRVKAFANAKARAAALAEAAGAKLGPALMISTTGDVAMPRPPMPMMAMAKSMDSGEASMAPSLPGVITLNETVTVTFGLE